jgi:hypothetical protein
LINIVISYRLQLGILLLLRKRIWLFMWRRTGDMEALAIFKKGI